MRAPPSPLKEKNAYREHNPLCSEYKRFQGDLKARKNDSR